MAELILEKAPQKVRDLFNKGFAAMERGNLEYAINLLSACVKAEPRLLQARRYLMAAVIRQFKQDGKGGTFGRAMSMMTGAPAYLKVMALVKAEKNEEAMQAAEALLMTDPLNVKYIKLFTQTAAAANYPEVAIQTLEMAREQYPRDIFILNWLGSMYLKVGRTRSARECFETLCEVCPNDPMAHKALKDATALDTMGSGWEEVAEKGGTYRDLIKDEKESERLEKESKAVKTEKDVEVLISDMQEKMKAEPGNINYYRALSRLFADKKAFPDAIATLERAMEISPGDPELDAMLMATKVMQYDDLIETLAGNGDTKGAEQKRMERDQYRFDNLQDRVKRYPNDLKLRYELGVMLFDNDYLNEAIQQFQLSQRSPKYRLRTLYYLAMCFKKKKQLDLAKEQLTKALDESEIMDDTKKDILYELGAICELMGERENAVEYYKQVYQVDIGYKDVAAKVERAYQA